MVWSAGDPLAAVKEDSDHLGISARDSGVLNSLQSDGAIPANGVAEVLLSLCLLCQQLFETYVATIS